MIPQEALEEFKRICQAYLDRELSDEGAQESASRVIAFLRASEPVPTTVRKVSGGNVSDYILLEKSEQPVIQPKTDTD